MKIFNVAPNGRILGEVKMFDKVSSVDQAAQSLSTQPSGKYYVQTGPNNYFDVTVEGGNVFGFDQGGYKSGDPHTELSISSEAERLSKPISQFGGIFADEGAPTDPNNPFAHGFGEAPQQEEAPAEEPVEDEASTEEPVEEEAAENAEVSEEVAEAEAAEDDFVLTDEERQSILDARAAATEAVGDEATDENVEDAGEADDAEAGSADADSGDGAESTE